MKNAPFYLERTDTILMKLSPKARYPLTLYLPNEAGNTKKFLGKYQDFLESLSYIW